MKIKILQSESLSIPPIIIERRIFLIRGVKVMLDSDLAELYDLPVKVLVQSLKRNPDRFPDDFMFQLTKEEFDSLRSQIVTSNTGRGGRRYLPYAFTEHGVSMLSSVLNSKRAVQLNILIIRTFIKIREILASNKELSYKIEELEREQRVQNKHINAIYSILGKFLEEPVKPKGSIGFTRE
jgi:phage regulator Rha-like protein